MGIAVGTQQLANMNGAGTPRFPARQALDNPSTPNDIWQPIGDSMILVNKYGKRVVNEKRSYNDRTKVHFYWDPVEQEYPNQILCMIYDGRTAKHSANPSTPTPSDSEHFPRNLFFPEKIGMNWRKTSAGGQWAELLALAAGAPDKSFGENLKGDSRAFQRLQAMCVTCG
ncbi:hypothetical protein MASR1M66_04180 [Aminivibrio sp.]